MATPFFRGSSSQNTEVHFSFPNVAVPAGAPVFNDGVAAVAARLKKRKERSAASALIVGGNIGKNKITGNEDAWKDYHTCFDALFDCVDYFVVNVSSPNTPGLRELQEKDSLKKILGNLQNNNQGRQHPKPLLLKIAPDLTQEQLDDIVSLAFEVQLSGLVATNTTISREGLRTSGTRITAIGAGGLSGRPVRERATEILQYLSKQTNGNIPVIASGGIFTGAAFFHLRLLGAAGYEPQLDRRGLCATPVENERDYALHAGRGFLVCGRCLDEQRGAALPLSMQTLRFLQHALHADPKNLTRLRLSQNNALEALHILHRYTQHLLQHDIHAWHQVRRLAADQSPLSPPA